MDAPCAAGVPRPSFGNDQQLGLDLSTTRSNPSRRRLRMPGAGLLWHVLPRPCAGAATAPRFSDEKWGADMLSGAVADEGRTLTLTGPAAASGPARGATTERDCHPLGLRTSQATR